jgi:hypothetical protein
MHSAHNHEHERLFLSCKKCGSTAMLVIVMQGALLFNCADCSSPTGMMENVEKETRQLLDEGCQNH